MFVNNMLDNEKVSCLDPLGDNLKLGNAVKNSRKIQKYI